MILAFFGGLRHTETMDLVIEHFQSNPEGVYVTHQRAKQRSDKRNSKFLVPRTFQSSRTSCASVVETYLTTVKEDLGKMVGKVLWTGRNDTFAKTPIEKNMVAKVMITIIIIII